MLPLLILTALAILLTGCAAQPTSWAGMRVVEGVIYAADIQQVVTMQVQDDDSYPREIWAFPPDPKEERLGLFYVTPAVSDEYVIVASQVPASGFFSQPVNVVWALDRETGQEVWRFNGARAQYVEGGAIAGDLFVIGNSDGNVYALDLETGREVWRHKTAHRVWATPLIHDDVVYIGSMDRHLYALNLADGAVLWDFPADGAFAGTPAWEEGHLYIGAFDNRLYAIDAQTGTEEWRFEGSNWFWGGPVVHDGVVYAVDVDGNAYAVDAQEGVKIWKRSLDTTVRAGLALYVDEDSSQIFVGGQNGTLYALDAAEGFVMWSTSREGQILSPPVVAEDVVYTTVSFDAERIRAALTANGRTIWVYPLPEQE